VIAESTNSYDLLARLVAYPEASFFDDVAQCRQALQTDCPRAGTLVSCFEEAIRGETVEEVDELFTRTFDINPICSLEVGWQLFGENYSRGEFLVSMRQTLRDLDLPESTELPDHLMHVLAILGRMEDERADGFAAACVQPAVDKMLKGLKGKSNPYANVLEAIREVLELRHPNTGADEKPDGGKSWN